MTGRRRALIVFALTFVIMIVSFIPLGRSRLRWLFVAGQPDEEVTTTVAGDEVIAAYDEANGTTTEVAAPFEATSVSEEESHPAWSSLPYQHSSGPVVLRRGLHVVPAHGAHHRRHRRRVREPLREGVHQLAPPT